MFIVSDLVIRTDRGGSVSILIRLNGVRAYYRAGRQYKGFARSCFIPRKQRGKHSVTSL